MKRSNHSEKYSLNKLNFNFSFSEPSTILLFCHFWRKHPFISGLTLPFSYFVKCCFLSPCLQFCATQSLSLAAFSNSSHPLLYLWFLLICTDSERASVIILHYFLEVFQWWFCNSQKLMASSILAVLQWLALGNILFFQSCFLVSMKFIS